jgi:hypothetical protein
MVFGDPQRFAIEFVLDVPHGDVWLNGSAWYWIDGRQVGDVDLSVTLLDLMYLWEEMTDFAGMRDKAPDRHLSIKELIERSHRQWADREIGDEAEEIVDEHTVATQIAPSVEPFLGWTVRLFEEGEDARCVYFGGKEEGFGECHLKAGEVDGVLRAAVSALHGLYERELSPEELQTWRTRATPFQRSWRHDLEDRTFLIASRDDLVAFIRALQVDRRANPAQWENVTLEAYLDSMAAWINDADTYFEAKVSPTWEMIGDILLSPKFNK